MFPIASSHPAKEMVALAMRDGVSDLGPNIMTIPVSSGGNGNICHALLRHCVRGVPGRWAPCTAAAACLSEAGLQRQLEELRAVVGCPCRPGQALYRWCLLLLSADLRMRCAQLRRCPLSCLPSRPRCRRCVEIAVCVLSCGACHSECAADACRGHLWAHMHVLAMPRLMATSCPAPSDRAVGAAGTELAFVQVRLAKASCAAQGFALHRQCCPSTPFTVMVAVRHLSSPMPRAPCVQLIKSCAAREPTRDESKAALKVLAAGAEACTVPVSVPHMLCDLFRPGRLADPRLRHAACLQMHGVMPL